MMRGKLRRRSDDIVPPSLKSRVCGAWLRWLRRDAGNALIRATGGS
jgi:hypothetical protein